MNGIQRNHHIKKLENSGHSHLNQAQLARGRCSAVWFKACTVVFVLSRSDGKLGCLFNSDLQQQDYSPNFFEVSSINTVHYGIQHCF